MLEDRPILQRGLIGAAAFSFVFSAAMAGSAFMISGGFGAANDHHRAAPVSHDASAAEIAWSDWTGLASASPPMSEIALPTAVEYSADYPDGASGAARGELAGSGYEENYFSAEAEALESYVAPEDEALDPYLSYQAKNRSGDY